MDNLRADNARQLSEFNNMLTCRICQGYMIDPTTVDYCYHTFCRSCILKHLLRDAFCPQCKALSGGKHITEDNLRSDDTLRALIYKLVPGLYQRECERLVEFEEQHRDLDVGELLKPDQEQEFFTLAEPISLSLEYHPAMLKHCGAADKPPVCYLQCPAGLRVVHLKRFLCSKYDIDAANKQVEVEVTYEDEILPPSFTLMDVGYCYQWSRHAPMAFRYRILLHESGTTKNDENNLSKVNQDIELSTTTINPVVKSVKTVTFADELETGNQQANKTRSKSATKATKSKRQASGKRERERAESTEDSACGLSNFKSLRSNDMRYSDYGIAATTTTTTTATTAAATPLLRVKSEPEPEEQSSLGVVVPNMNILVSIPQSQLSKSVAYGDEGGFELKTANRKNLPKLKIELNSMKSKLTMPKSADARLEETCGVQQQLDLETYAKNIGLKPIEPAATAIVANATPTNGANGISIDASTSTNTSSSSHRKRKKKHSKEPKDASGKRKKLHAEISSQTDGKMKMKITTTHNHKSHKMELKRSHSLAGGELVSLNQLKLSEQPNEALNRTLGEEARSITSLMTTTSSNNTSVTAEQQPPRAASKELGLPVSPPLPPSLFKAFTPAAGSPSTNVAGSTKLPSTTTTTTAQQLLPKPLKPPLSNTNNIRKPTTMVNPLTATTGIAATLPPTPHFLVPQPRHAPQHMQRYLSTPTSIASAANKQPKRSLSLDGEAAQQQQLLAKHPRLDYQQQQQLSAKYAAATAKHKASVYAPQLRLYGPEMNKSTHVPMLCPTSLSLSLPSSSTVTITPRPRSNHGLSYPYAEATLNQLPALEIVRLGQAASGAGNGSGNGTGSGAGSGRIMGPPRQPLKRATVAAAAAAMQLPIPAIVKSPPLSVALSAQRGSNQQNSNINSGNYSNNNNNAAYRTSPPALINLRNTVPLAFPSKSSAAAKAEVNSKKSATVAATAAAAAATSTAGAATTAAAATTSSSSSQSKANGTTALDKSKTSLRDFRLLPLAATTTTTTAAAAAKDADILDLSAAAARSNNSNNSSSSAKQSATVASKLAPTSAAASNNSNNTNNSSSSNSLEAALNKIKQNINANSNNCSSAGNNAAGTAATAAAIAAAAAGDDLQNLHMLSESATAREKISIKAGGGVKSNISSSSSNNNSSSNIYENKPKNALVRPQNASVRSIPNPSALAFRNQLLTTSNNNNSSGTTTTLTAAATIASITVKPLAVKADEKPKLSTMPTLLSPSSNNNNNNNNNSTNNNNNNNNNNNAATSPRAIKKATTIDQVAANLNIRAEAKAAALAEETPLSLGAKTPELEKPVSSSSSNNNNSSSNNSSSNNSSNNNNSSNSVSKTDVEKPTVAVAATPATLSALTLPTKSTTTTTATTTATAGSVNVKTDSMSKPPVQIAATDTLAPVASSA